MTSGASRRALVEGTLRAMRRAMWPLRNRIEAVYANRGLAGSHHFILRFLVSKGRMTQTQLGGMLGVTAGHVTGLLDRLEKDGCVKRVRSTKDRRVVFVEATRKGRKTFSEMRTIFTDEALKVFEGWTPDEIRRLRDLLSRLAGSDVEC